MELLLLPLSAIIYEDFKYRAIHWWWIVSIAILGILLREVSVYGILLNLLFISLQLFTVTIYFSIKQKEFINIMNNLLGLGDILFFISMAFWFSPLDFIHFNIYSMIFALIGTKFLKSTTNDENLSLTIPLAGWMAIFVIIQLVLNWSIHYNILSKWQMIH
jgi:hypothetical protein